MHLVSVTNLHGLLDWYTDYLSKLLRKHLTLKQLVHLKECDSEVHLKECDSEVHLKECDSEVMLSFITTTGDT